MTPGEIRLWDDKRLITADGSLALAEDCCCWECPTTEEVQPAATVALLVEACEDWVEATVAGEYTYNGMEEAGGICWYTWYLLSEWDDEEFYWWIFMGETTSGGVGGVCRCIGMAADDPAPSVGDFGGDDCPCVMGGTDAMVLVTLDGADLWTGIVDLPGVAGYESEGCTVRVTLNP